MDRWRGKVAIITGASSGIGEAIAKRLVEEGINVAGFARRSERVEELSKKLADKKGKLYAVKCDITKEEDIFKGFQWVTENMGPVHILVNNAAIIRLSNFTEGNTDDWKEVLDTNVLGLCICTREAVKSMKEHNIDGHIVHINSVAGHWVVNFPQINIYCASKFAVTALTDSLRKEFTSLGSNIKVTSVSPGAVQTEMAASTMGQERIKSIPILKSEDVADAVSYVIGTAPHILIQELIIRPVGETF